MDNLPSKHTINFFNVYCIVSNQAYDLSLLSSNAHSLLPIPLSPLNNIPIP